MPAHRTYAVYHAAQSSPPASVWGDINFKRQKPILEKSDRATVDDDDETGADFLIGVPDLDVDMNPSEDASGMTRAESDTVIPVPFRPAGEEVLYTHPVQQTLPTSSRPPQNPKRGVGIQWSDPMLFEELVHKAQTRIMAESETTQHRFKSWESHARNAFVGFCVVYEKYVYRTSDREDAATAQQSPINMVPALMQPLPANDHRPASMTGGGRKFVSSVRAESAGNVRSSPGFWKQGIPDLANRYIELLKFTDTPQAGRDDENLTKRMRRLKLWMDEWDHTKPFHETSVFTRMRRSPAWFGTSNWDRFLHLHSQFAMMELLFMIFTTLLYDFSFNRNSWNGSYTDNIVDVIAEYTATYAGSRDLNSFGLRKRGKYGTRAQDVALQASIGVVQGAMDLFLKPRAYRALFGAIRQAFYVKGSGQIADNVLAQLGAVSTETGSSEGRDLAADDDVPRGLRAVMPFIATYAAVHDLFSRSRGSMPSYLRTLLGGGGHSVPCAGSRPGDDVARISPVFGE